MLGARTRLLHIAERRARYVERAAAEREALARALAASDTAASLLAGARRVLEGIAQQPLVVAAGIALLVVLQPRRALGWLMKGWSAWRVYRSARRYWQRLAAAAAGTSPAR